MKKKIHRVTHTRTFLGEFDIGEEFIDVWTDESVEGGDATLPHGDLKKGEITVGLKQPCWWEVVNTLLHESFEYCCSRFGHEFEQCSKDHFDSANFLIVLDHMQFTSMMARTSRFVTPILPELAGVYNAMKRKQRRRRRK